MGERHLIEGRIRRLNDLGFDVGELIVEQEAGADRLRVTPALVEEGHHARELRRLTGLEVQENQARRLLNDIAAFGAYLARVEGRPPPQAVVAARWIAEVYEPIVAEIPPELRGRLEPPSCSTSSSSTATTSPRPPATRSTTPPPSGPTSTLSCDSGRRKR